MRRTRASLWILGSVALGLGQPACAAPEPELAVEITPDVVYGHKTGLALTLDVYRPAQQNGAAVVFLVSGNWQSRYEWRQFTESGDGAPRLSSAVELARIAPSPLFAAFDLRPLLEKGFTVFAVRHGSSPRFDLSEIVADVHRAVRFVRRHAQDHGVDPARIGLWGASAGGHLSLVLGMTPEYANARAPRVAAIVAYYPPTDLGRYARDLAAAGRELPAVLDVSDEERRKYSPVHFASPGDPPTLIVHGDGDRTVSIVEGRSLHEALVNAGVESRLVVVGGAGHGFVGDDAERAARESVRWFERHLLGD